jgi:hypothetical protein
MSQRNPESLKLADDESRTDLPLDVEKNDSLAAPAAPGPSASGPGGPPQHVFPEGGRKAWLSVVGVWCIMFITFGYVNCFG